MKFSYNWLKEYLGGKLPTPKKAAEAFIMHSFEVDSVSAIRDDYVLDIDILPNRAHDCFSHLGVARELAAVLNLKFRPPLLRKENLAKGHEINKFLKIEVKEPKLCSRYTARLLKDTKVGPSPNWLKKRLEICGLKPINNVVDVTNYVMLEYGQPLHAFDLKKIAGGKIIVRRAKEKEKITTLDDKKYELSGEILIIADSESPLAIAGIKGGKKAEITEETKDIVLEGANFEAVSIRKTSRRLNLKTDASVRFEHGLDPNLVSLALDRAALLIKTLAKGKITKGMLDIFSERSNPAKIVLDLARMRQFLGIQISEPQVLRISKKLVFKYQKRGRSLLVIPPSQRLDLKIPEDLIEEIARLYGFNKIKSQIPTSTLIPPRRNDNIFWENFVKDNLSALGFTEVYNYPFVSGEDLKRAAAPIEKCLSLKNPQTRDEQYLASTLLINLLKNVRENLKNFGTFNLFEISKAYRKEKEDRKSGQFLIIERNMLSGVMVAGVSDNTGTFFEAKGILTQVINKMGISDIWFDDCEATPEETWKKIWHPGRSGEIKVGEEEIGFFGEIHPEVRKNFEIGSRVIAFDLDFEKLVKEAAEEYEYKEFPRHPAAVRDLAIIIPEALKISEVQSVIFKAGEKFVSDVDLFDIYQGENIDAGKKSVAFHIVYQLPTRTLTDKEVDKVQQKIIKALEEELEAEIRGNKQ